MKTKLMMALLAVGFLGSSNAFAGGTCTVKATFLQTIQPNGAKIKGQTTQQVTMQSADRMTDLEALDACINANLESNVLTNDPDLVSLEFQYENKETRLSVNGKKQFKSEKTNKVSLDHDSGQF